MTKTNRNLMVLLLCSLIVIASLACNKSSQQTSQPSSADPASAAKHYQLKGKVLSIDTRAKMANIDAAAIPGFMDAMTMPYTIKPDSDLDKLYPGDMITGDLVVKDDDSWLEKIVVTGHSHAHK